MEMSDPVRAGGPGCRRKADEPSAGRAGAPSPEPQHISTAAWAHTRLQRSPTKLACRSISRLVKTTSHKVTMPAKLPSQARSPPLRPACGRSSSCHPAWHLVLVAQSWPALPGLKELFGSYCLASTSLPACHLCRQRRRQLCHRVGALPSRLHQQLPGLERFDVPGCRRLITVLEVAALHHVSKHFQGIVQVLPRVRGRDADPHAGP